VGGRGTQSRGCSSEQRVGPAERRQLGLPHHLESVAFLTDEEVGVVFCGLRGGEHPQDSIKYLLWRSRNALLTSPFPLCSQTRSSISHVSPFGRPYRSLYAHSTPSPHLRSLRFSTETTRSRRFTRWATNRDLRVPRFSRRLLLFVSLISLSSRTFPNHSTLDPLHLDRHSSSPSSSRHAFSPFSSISSSFVRPLQQPSDSLPSSLTRLLGRFYS
jgi:hypothetical protein